MVVYLHDMLFLHQWEEKFTQIRNLVVDLLGFLVNYKKSVPAVLPAPLHYRGLQSLKHKDRGISSSNLPFSYKDQFIESTPVETNVTCN